MTAANWVILASAVLPAVLGWLVLWDAWTIHTEYQDVTVRRDVVMGRSEEHTSELQSR